MIEMKTIEQVFPVQIKRVPIELEKDAHLAVCHLIGGANGLPWDKELSDEQIKAHVAKCIRVYNEIKTQLISGGTV
jgi:hypothetical protein